MRRIAIIGNGGGGKSTLARERSAAKERWIVDGFGPWRVIDRRMADAGTIVFVDLPFRTQLWWAAKRQVVTKHGRDVKLVHLRSPREIARWLDKVTRTTVEVAD